MDVHEAEFPSGEKVTFITFSEEEWNLIAAQDCGRVRLLDNDAACVLGPLDGSISFGEITPEDIIGSGVGARDWTQRTKREMPVWHRHVEFSALPGVLCAEVHADSEDEADDEALARALLHLESEGIWSGGEVTECQESLHREGYHIHDLGYCCLGGCVGVTVLRAGVGDR